jgi:hypothetical protein
VVNIMSRQAPVRRRDGALTHRGASSGSQSETFQGWKGTERATSSTECLCWPRFWGGSISGHYPLTKCSDYIRTG